MGEGWMYHITQSLRDRYDFHNFNHAVEIMALAYDNEFREIMSALEDFSLSKDDLIAAGGNESSIPKKLSSFLRPRAWQEVKISGDLIVRLNYRNSSEAAEEKIIKDFIGGHNIDYVKNRVALDLEWNSKDQTFDRDLYAMRAFYECGIIACGVIITRSEKLNPVFHRLGIIQKYGASTTWMGKLLPRIQSGRHGGCPLLVIGITPGVITDLEDISGGV